MRREESVVTTACPEAVRLCWRRVAMVLNSRCAGLKVRQLQSADAPVAVSMVRQFRGAQVALSYLERLLQSPANFLIVAEADGALLGFLLRIASTGSTAKKRTTSSTSWKWRPTGAGKVSGPPWCAIFGTLPSASVSRRSFSQTTVIARQLASIKRRAPESRMGTTYCSFIRASESFCHTWLHMRMILIDWRRGAADNAREFPSLFLLSA